MIFENCDLHVSLITGRTYLLENCFILERIAQDSRKSSKNFIYGFSGRITTKMTLGFGKLILPR